MRKYTFPATKEEISNCYDLDMLNNWKHQFEQTFNQVESDWGGMDNLPERLFKYINANRLNLRQINFKIKKLSSPVSSVGALKCFHDTAKETLPDTLYETIVGKTKMILGCVNKDWDDMIKKPSWQKTNTKNR